MGNGCIGLYAYDEHITSRACRGRAGAFATVGASRPPTHPAATQEIAHNKNMVNEAQANKAQATMPLITQLNTRAIRKTTLGIG